MAGRAAMAMMDRALEKAFGPRILEVRRPPLDELILTILSQNTNDTNCLRAFTSLRTAFPKWQAVLDAPREAVEEAIRTGGLARTKSARIQRILRAVLLDGALDMDALAGLPTEEVERRLLALDGVGYKTARCVLLFSLGRDVFPVDTHIHRILLRTGLIPEGASADQAHVLAPSLIPPGRAYALHMNLIALGRAICAPRHPKCAECPIRRYCNHGQITS